jgi:hypothetical protein
MNSFHKVADIHRRIRNILAKYPATDWDEDQSSAVLKALSEIFVVRTDQPVGDVVDLGGAAAIYTEVTDDRRAEGYRPDSTRSGDVYVPTNIDSVGTEMPCVSTGLASPLVDAQCL